MIIIKCGNYDYDKPGMVKLCEPYLTVGELREKLKWFDQDEAVCVDTVGAYFRNIDDLVEEEE